jgi:hypothetical protein
MNFHHGPPNQPSWGYPCDTPMPPAPTGVPNASPGQMLIPSRSTRPHVPAPLTRSYHLPPVSAQQHLPPSAHAHSASYSHQLDAGVLSSSSSSGYHLSPRSQNTPHIPTAPVFVSGLISVFISSSPVLTPSTTGLRSLFSLQSLSFFRE